MPAPLSQPVGSQEDVIYHFPYARSAVELIPDSAGTFGIRLFSHRGRTILPLFETSPLRPIAQVLLRGQTFPAFLNQHSRKRRDRIVLGGRRKTARSERSSLRFLAFLEGRSDRLTWNWRIGATAAALAAPVDTSTFPFASEPKPETREPLPDTVTLHLPFANGNARVVKLDAIDHALALWMHDLVVTVVAHPNEGAGVQTLTEVPRGFDLVLAGADLSGHGVNLTWETWISPARKESDAHAALEAHVADLSDRLQSKTTTRETFLNDFADTAIAALTDDSRLEKRAADRLMYRLEPKQIGVGETVDAAQAACAILSRFYFNGDDALRRKARLIARGVCDFQVNQEESPHWGAIWDTQRDKKRFEAFDGSETVGVSATARACRGLHILQAHFEVDIYARTAHNAAQWLLLKNDRDGLLMGERFRADGPPVDDFSVWISGEALIPLVETFRATNNETFLRAAHRTIRMIRERMESGALATTQATTSMLASTIEGVLLASREYESESLITLAQSIGTALKTRRRPDGSFVDPKGRDSELTSTLAGARAALALARVDPDPLWPVLALRSLRAAKALAGDAASLASVADLGQIALHSVGLLLTIAARAKNCVADRDLCTLTRGWQAFIPDTGVREYVQVTAEDGRAVDSLILVCPTNLQVLVVVIAPPDIARVSISKNRRTPFVRDLISGDYDQATPLSPLGDGTEANIGIFLADT